MRVLKRPAEAPPVPDPAAVSPRAGRRGTSLPGRLAALWRPRPLPRLGEVLLREGLVTEPQLARALELQQSRREPLGRLVVHLGYATEAQVVEAIARHYRVGASSLTDDIPGLIDERTRVHRTLARWRRGVQAKLVLALLAVAWLAIFSLSAVLLTTQSSDLQRQATQLGAMNVNLMAEQALPALRAGDGAALQRIVDAAMAAQGAEYALIADARGTVRAHTDAAQRGARVPDFKPAGPIQRFDGVMAFPVAEPDGTEVLHLYRRLTRDGAALGEVHLGLSQAFIADRMEHRTVQIALLSVLILSLGAALAMLLGGALMGPLSGLMRTALDFGSGRGEGRPPASARRNGRGGLDDLAHTFDAVSGAARSRDQLERSFGSYVGHEVLSLLRTNPRAHRLEAQRGEATLLFTDVRGFTTLAAEREPEALVESLNEYFTLAAEAIRAMGGYVDKYIGDAVLGVFGLPEGPPDHAERAVRAAVTMQKAFRRRARNSRNPLLERVGIGINTGVVVSGSLGPDEKMEYAVIGDSVNVASRLNGLAAAGEIIVSASVYAGLPRSLVTVKALPPQHVKGRSEPVSTYKVLRTEF